MHICKKQLFRDGMQSFVMHKLRTLHCKKFTLESPLNCIISQTSNQHLALKTDQDKVAQNHCQKRSKSKHKPAILEHVLRIMLV